METLKLAQRKPFFSIFRLNSGLNSGLNAGLFVLLLATLGHGMAHAAALDELTPADQDRVKRGEKVTLTEPVTGSVWPRTKVYQRLPGKPEGYAAQFNDYREHVRIFDDLRKSEISQQVDRTTVEVSYLMTFPKIEGLPVAIPDENYVTRNTLSTPDQGVSYRIDWTFVRADTMKDCNGSLRVEPLQGDTLLVYTNFINPPKPSLAKLITRLAISRVEKAVDQIGAYTQKEYREHPSVVEDRIRALRRAVGLDR